MEAKEQSGFKFWRHAKNSLCRERHSVGVEGARRGCVVGRSNERQRNGLSRVFSGKLFS